MQPDPQPAHVPPPPPPLVVPRPPTSGWATASLVLGILGLLCGWCLLGIPCLLAVIFGHLGVRATRDERRGGRRAAVAGLVLGYVALVPAVVITVLGGIGVVLDVTQPKPEATVTTCRINDQQNVAWVGVTVTNKGSISNSYTVRVAVLDGDGASVGEGRVYVSNVAPGQTATGEGTIQLDADGGTRCTVTKVF
jgi:hypothetical protein